MHAEPHWRELYPFASHFLGDEGQRMHYLDEGSGEPLLMVHGNPTWSFYWRNLVLGLREEYRAVVPDHVGCGLSDKPADYQYSLTRHTEKLVELVKRLDLRDVTLLAHDWGGPIGLGAVLAEPARFRRIVLFNTAAFPPPFCPWRIRACRTPLVGEYGVRKLNWFAGAAVRMAVAKRHRMTPQVRAGLLAPYDNWDNRVALYQFVRDIPLTKRHPTWRVLADLQAGLDSLSKLPVQIIWGMRDWCFSVECLQRMWELFPQASVHRLGDASHYVIEDAHERIIPLVRRFLMEHPLSGGPNELAQDADTAGANGTSANDPAGPAAEDPTHSVDAHSGSAPLAPREPLPEPHREAGTGSAGRATREQPADPDQ